MKLARDWPDFAVSWENMERELVARHNPRRPNAVNLALKFKILSIVIMSLALGKKSSPRKPDCSMVMKN